jgi:hypothetical protein
MNRLKFEIDGLKFDNSKLVFKTNSLETHINELQQEIGNSIQKTELMRRLAREDDRNINELNKLLNDIRSTKLLLRKSNYLPSNNVSDYFTNPYPPITASLHMQSKQPDYNINPLLSTFNFSKTLNDNDKKFNQKFTSNSVGIFNSENKYNSNKKTINSKIADTIEQKPTKIVDPFLESNSFLINSKNTDFINEDIDKAFTKSELNKVREELNRFQADNRELKK